MFKLQLDELVVQLPQEGAEALHAQLLLHVRTEEGDQEAVVRVGGGGGRIPVWGEGEKDSHTLTPVCRKRAGKAVIQVGGGRGRIYPC